MDVEGKVENGKMVCDISETAKWLPYSKGTLSSTTHQLTINVLHVPVWAYLLYCFGLIPPEIYKICIEVIHTIPDHAMAYVLSHRLLTMEAWVQSHANPCGICHEKGGTGACFSLCTLSFQRCCVQFINPSLTLYSLNS